MSANKNRPHVLVLPEDDANSRLANGFQLQVDPARLRRMQVLPVAGGWNEVLEHFVADHIREMDLHTLRFMVLLIDFDRQDERLSNARSRIPERLPDRVFILGAWANLKISGGPVSVSTRQSGRPLHGTAERELTSLGITSCFSTTRTNLLVFVSASARYCFEGVQSIAWLATACRAPPRTPAPCCACVRRSNKSPFR